MTHLDMTQLLAARADQSEPGAAAARAHLVHCAHCRTELERLEQRMARLRALPSLRPARDAWPLVQRRLAGERRRRWVQRTGWSVLALAAGIALVFSVRSGALGMRSADQLHAAPGQEIGVGLEGVKRRSQVLEAALEEYGPETRVLDGRTAVVADALQDRIARLDAQLQSAQLEGPDRGAVARDARLRALWEERIGLLDALVDVRVTRASNVGL